MPRNINTESLINPSLRTIRERNRNNRREREASEHDLPQGPPLAFAQVRYYFYAIETALFPKREDIIRRFVKDGLRVVDMLEDFWEDLDPGSRLARRAIREMHESFERIERAIREEHLGAIHRAVEHGLFWDAILEDFWNAQAPGTVPPKYHDFMLEEEREEEDREERDRRRFAA